MEKSGSSRGSEEGRISEIARCTSGGKVTAPEVRVVGLDEEGSSEGEEKASGLEGEDIVVVTAHSLLRHDDQLVEFGSFQIFSSALLVVGRTRRPLQKMSSISLHL